MAYTKLHEELVTSTIWRESHQTRIMWVTMMAMANKHGEVYASIPGLADMARVTLPECESALEAFLAPDKYSRTPDHEGRRIERISGGWSLLNHEKYRLLCSKEEEREATAERVARHRARKKPAGATETPGNASVTVGNAPVTVGRDIAEAEAEANTRKTNPPHPPEISGGSHFHEFWKNWPQHPRKVARPQCLKKWQSLGCDALSDQVLDALDAAKQSKEWAKDSGEFIPAPLVWLNQARWEAPTKTEALVAAPSPTAWRHSGQQCQYKAEEMGIKQEHGEFNEQFMVRVFQTWERRQKNHQGVSK